MNNSTFCVNQYRFAWPTILWRNTLLIPIFFLSLFSTVSASNDFSFEEDNFSCRGEVTDVWLVGTNGEVSLKPGQAICRSDINFSEAFIRVRTRGQVGSMRIWVSGPVNHDVLENHSPYDGKRFTIKNGAYKVRTRIFTEQQGGGQGCEEATFTFSITDCAAPVCDGKANSIELVGTNGRTIRIAEGQEICTRDINFREGFVRVATTGRVGSARIWIRGAVSNDVLENFAPYDSKTFSIKAGEYRVNTKIFAESQGKGDVCNEQTFTFSIVECAAACNVNGGALAGGPFEFCVGNGEADNIPAGSITLAGGKGTERGWIVTDDQGNILGLPPMPSVVDFDGAGDGVCLVWYIAYEPGLRGLEVGKNAGDLQGCFDLSNSIAVNRVSEGGPCPPTCRVDGGVLAGGPFEFCVGNGEADNIPAGSITLAGGKGTERGWIVTDDQGNILGLPPMPSVVDFDGAGDGVCLVWYIAYEPGLRGLEVGKNAGDLQGCFDLSNSIAVNRVSEGGPCPPPPPRPPAAACNGRATGITLIGTNGRKVSVRNGQEICSSRINFSKGFIRVGTAGKVGSARIRITGPVNNNVLDNRQPFNSKNFTVKSGQYSVKVSIFSRTKGNGIMCSERTFTFSIKDCGASAQPNCDNIKIQTANNRITISKLDGAPNSSVSVTRNGRNTFNCRGNCKGTETVRVGRGKFQIKVTYFNKSWKQLCTKTTEFNNNNLVGTSSSRSASPSDDQIATEATIPSGGVSLSVYPNPANTSLTIDATSLIGKKGQLSVMNPFGQVVNQFDLGAIQDGAVQLDVSTYQAGLYLISASLADGEQFFEKVIIK